MRTAIPLTVLVTGLACSLFTASAQARARVFVASYGNDSNPCTFGSPCKTFQQAVNVVDPNGEVTAIDSAGFGPISINGKSVTITSPAGVEAGIAAPAPGTAAITINGPAIVNLSGLTLDGAHVANSTGISLSGAGGFLTVRDCVIRNFGQDGIDFHTDGGGGVLSVSNTVVSDNGNTGIAYYPSGTINVASVTLNRVEMRNNSKYGFFLWGSLSTPPLNTPMSLTASVFESTVSGSLLAGLYALTTLNNSFVDIELFHSVVTANGVGLLAEGYGIISVANSNVTANVWDWQGPNNGLVQSYGDNYSFNNVNSSGAMHPVPRN